MTVSRTTTVPPFRVIYEGHFDHIWRTLRRLGVAHRDLEDVAHEVFVVVHRRLDSFDPARPLRPWLTGIAYKVAADERRRARHHREQIGAPADLERRAGTEDGPETQLARAQDRALVAQALEALSMDQRIVFVMVCIDGHTSPEVAEALELALNTVYSRLRVARQNFARAVKQIRLRGAA